MRILVTGGAGFIGSNLTRRLSAMGHDAVVLDDFSTGLKGNLDGTNAEVRCLSLVDADAVRVAASGADAIVHLGARGSVPRSLADPQATHAVNATGTLNVLEAARASGAYVIFSSSSSVYGANPALPKTERAWTQPMSPYGASKLAAEGYVFGFRESYGMDALVLRFFNVFGPWQRPDHDYAAVVPRWLWRAMRDEVIEIHGDGSQTRDFTFVDSVIDVIVSALSSRISPDSPVNLAFGRSLSLLEVIAQLERLLGREIRTSHHPARIGDVRHSLNDPRLLNELFPDVRPTPFDEGLARTRDWLESQMDRSSREYASRT